MEHIYMRMNPVGKRSSDLYFFRFMYRHVPTWT